jgi:hypothetical protein
MQTKPKRSILKYNVLDFLILIIRAYLSEGRDLEFAIRGFIKNQPLRFGLRQSEAFGTLR